MIEETVREYKTKILTKLAIKWTGKNLVEIHNFVGKALCPIERRPDYDLKIKNRLGEVIVNKGDYIIKGEYDFYPCHPEVFHNSYELLDKN